jgi:hypothetical protein
VFTDSLPTTAVVYYVQKFQSESKSSFNNIFSFDIDINCLADYFLLQLNELLDISYFCIVSVRDFSLSPVFPYFSFNLMAGYIIFQPDTPTTVT